jgi:hypothetical protein
MGSAALGGGSGSFGGGSGAGGSGAGGGGDSLFKRLKNLIDLTRNLNRDPNLAAARVAVFDILQNRNRGKYVVRLLDDPFVQAVYRELLDWGEAWQREKRADAVSTAAGIDPSGATLQSLAYAIVDAKKQTGTDERFVDIVQTTVTGIFHRCVEDDRPDLYMDRTLAQLGDQFHPAALDNLAGRFLAGMLNGVIQREVRSVDVTVVPSLTTAIDEISTAWVDRFRANHRRGSLTQRDMLGVIAGNWPQFSGAK